MKTTLTLFALLFSLILFPAFGQDPTALLPRLIVETDAGGDPDDEGSLVRLLMFADQFDLELIIADRSNSQIEGRSNYQNLIKGSGGDGEDLVERYITDYGDLYPNLIQHSPNFPTEAYLKSIAVSGKASTNAGRDAIISIVDADDPRPVWYGNWGSNSGTTSNLKRALDYVESTRSQAEYEKFASRILICTLDGKNSTRQGHSDVIKLHIETGYPDLGGRWYHQFRPITEFAGGFNVSRDLEENHGDLGANYTTAKEGDSWCFVYLQNQAIGLGVPTRVSWGGWGGRYAGLRSGANFPNDVYYWNDQQDTWNGSTNRNNTAARYAADMQHHFAARMDWGQTGSFANANHAPEVVVNGDDSGTVVRMFATPGQQVVLNAAGTTDPDGDAISYQWIRYDEADSYSGNVSIAGSTSEVATLTVPANADGKDIHVYLEVTDDGDATPADGNPSLKGYRRVVIYVRDQLKIMALGDSLTEGHHHSDNGNGAYRNKFWQLTQSAGWNVDMVGSQTDGPSSMDVDHEGYVGYRIDEMYGDADGTEPDVNLVQKLNTYQPDIILFQIGGNDAIQNFELATAHERHMKVLQLIYDTRPDTLVIFTTQPNNFNKSNTNDNVDLMNLRIPEQEVAAYQIGQWAILFDMHAIITPQDLQPDETHPNQVGDDKIGQGFFDVVASVRASGTVNAIPSADAGSDQTVPDTDGQAGEPVSLDGSGSSDSDGSLSSYSWEESGSTIATGATPTVNLSDGVHTITLTVTDDGGATDSDTVVVTVVSPPDFEAPSVPTNLAASNTTNSATTLTWTASTDNLDPSPSYEIFQNGASLATTDSIPYTVSGLSGSSTYTFSVRAVDAADNSSAQSDTVEVTTLDTPPVFLEEGGLLVMEAENFDQNTDQGDPWYAETTMAGYVGDGYVTTNDDGTSNGTWPNSDDLSYDFLISTPGTYSVWLRVAQDGGAANSGIVGIDGVGGDIDNGGGTGWYWVKYSNTYALDGEHIFHLQRREDGYKVDRILLTTDAGFTPSGDGPAESSRGGGSSQTPYESWAQGAGANDATLTGDANSDGIPNLLAYGLGFGPMDAVPEGSMPTVSTPEEFVDFFYRRNPAATDVTYKVRETTDLEASWSDVSVDGVNTTDTHVGTLGDGAEIWRLRMPLSTAGELHFFLLQVGLE